MADISELIIEVKKINETISNIGKVQKKLKETADSAQSLGKTIAAAWSFGKVLQAAKEFGDAWKDVQVTFRSFDATFGTFNETANKGVSELVNNFQETERSAKKLLTLIGSRTIDLGLDKDTMSNMSVELAKISQEIAQFYGQNVSEVGKKLSQALAGEVGGLKDIGIVINSSSKQFQQLVKDMQASTGASEEAAKAMVIYNEILKKTEKFKGTFDAQAKSLSQAFGNISNTLQSGAFAKAGEVLSAIFVPILNKVDAILNKPWVASIMGIVTALGLVLVQVLLIQKAMTGLNTTLLAAAGAKGIGGALAGVGAKLTGLLIKAFPPLLIVAAGAAIGYALGLAIRKVIDKIKSGEWANFSDFVDSVINWFKSLAQKIINWFKGQGFKDDEQINKEMADKFMAAMKEKSQTINDIVGSTNEMFEEWAKWARGEGKEKNLSAEEIRKKANDMGQRIQQLRDGFNDINEKFVKAAKAYNEQNQQGGTVGRDGQKYLDRVDDLKKLAEQRKQAMVNLKNATDEFEKLKEEYKKVFEKERQNKLKFSKEQFGLFTWYQDAMRTIEDGLGKTLPKDKVNDLNERIKKFQETFKFMNADEQKDAYKELSRMYLDKFNLEMDNLKKEQDLLSETNQMIQDYLAKAMEWSPSGVSGIRADTAEGYKFLTSSLGDLSQFKGLVSGQQNDAASLQREANKIAEKTKSSIDDIKQKMDKLNKIVTIVN